MRIRNDIDIWVRYEEMDATHGTSRMMYNDGAEAEANKTRWGRDVNGRDQKVGRE